jgi:hypothetical protein
MKRAIIVVALALAAATAEQAGEQTRFRGSLFVVASIARAQSFPPDGFDWNSPDLVTMDSDEVKAKLPPGSWCLVLSVHNNPGESYTYTYLRGTPDWCDKSDRVRVRDRKKR